MTPLTREQFIAQLNYADDTIIDNKFHRGAVAMTWPALPEQEWFTFKQAQHALSLNPAHPISRQTLYNWIEKGELEAVGLPFLRRISKASILRKRAFLQNPVKP